MLNLLGHISCQSSISESVCIWICIAQYAHTVDIESLKSQYQSKMCQNTSLLILYIRSADKHPSALEDLYYDAPEITHQYSIDSHIQQSHACLSRDIA